MRYMQIVKATDLDTARRAYLDLLQRRGIALTASTEIFVETVHRPEADRETWLCYIAVARPHAA